MPSPELPIKPNTLRPALEQVRVRNSVKKPESQSPQLRNKERSRPDYMRNEYWERQAALAETFSTPVENYEAAAKGLFGENVDLENLT